MKKTIRIAIFQLGLIGLLIPVSRGGAATFQNGDFELGASSWNSTGNVSISLTGEGSTNGPHATAYNTANSAPNGVLSQTFDTIALQVYTVSFDWGNYSPAGVQNQRLQIEVRNGSSASAGAEEMSFGSGTLNTIPMNGTTILQNTAVFVLNMDGNSTGTTGAAPTAEFSSAGFTFTAQSTTSTIVFSDIASGAGISSDGVLDNVLIVPEPSTWASVMVGSMALLGLRRRVARRTPHPGLPEDLSRPQRPLRTQCMKGTHGRLSPAIPSLVGSAILTLGTVAHALTFNTTFDPSVATSFGTKADQAEAAFTYAEVQYSHLFDDPITINITMAAVAGTGTLGESETQLAGFYSYTKIRNALIADATTTDDAISIVGISETSPVGASNWLTSTAQAKALGITGASDDTDGTTTFGAGFDYTFDPNNRAVAGMYDFVGIAEHEISEVMGRIPGLGTNFGDGGRDYLPLDLFRFTSAGTRGMTNGGNIYFSIDNGVTIEKYFNFPRGNGSDPQDWVTGLNDSFNAFSSPGVENDITNVDVKVMDVIGYDLTATPEPSATIFLIAGSAWLIGAYRKNR